MNSGWFRIPGWLWLAPLMIALLAVGIACGGEAATSEPAPTPAPTPTAMAAPTPQPTPTPVDLSSITSEMQKSIADAIAGLETPESMSQADVQQLVQDAVTQAAAAAEDPLSEADIARLVEAAVEQAASSAPEPLTEAQIASIVRAAVPTPVPTPTAVNPRAILEAGRYGGVVPMMTLAPPGTIDPHQGTLSQDVAPSTPIYNQLIEYDPHNFTEIIPDLAESWSVSDDGLSVTFKLFEGAKWHDGEEVTSEDVVFSLDRMTTSGEGAPRPNTGKLAAYYKAAEAVDTYTTKVDLNFPSAAFVNFLTVDFFKILPKHYIESGADINVFENAMGSGPFKPVSFTEGSSWVSERNENYFKDGLPYFDGFEVFIITDVGTQIAAYRTGRVLMSAQMENALAPDDVIRLQEDPDFTSKFDVWGPQECCNLHILLNVTAPPFDNPDIRRALFLAMDRQVIVEDIASGKWKVGAPMSPSSPYALPQDELMQLPGFRRGADGGKHPDDIAEAKSLLAAAGYTDDNKLDVEFLVAQIIQFPDIAQIYKAQWESVLPVNINLELTDIGTVFGRYIGKDYQMGTFGAAVLILDPDDMFGGLYRATDRNYTGWTDPKVEELFAQQQKETDVAKRIELSHQMQREVLEGAPPYLEYAWQTFTTIVSNRIKTKVGHYVQPKTIYSGYKHEHEWLEQ